MADLLLELFSEEIPARMQAEAALFLQNQILQRLLKENLLPPAGERSKSFVTPRRIAVLTTNLPTQQAASETELKGPKVGAPDAALQGFLKKNGLTHSELTERDGVYFAIVKKEGKQTADVLKSIIEDILTTFPWPKSMRWGAGSTSWVRPLHSILCIFGGKIVPVSFAGITAGNTTRGHRFLNPDVIAITNPADYEAALKKAHVLADRENRKDTILEQAENAAQKVGLTLKKDEGLLDEVTGLVECPVVLTGKIDSAFMDLPKEVLVSEMRAHQKYFALENADGTLSDTFLITSNMIAQDGGKAIIAGNERVLRARLSDGRFFWDQDRKKSLDAWAGGLKTVTFHAKLGSIADKVNLIIPLAQLISQSVAKANVDLVIRAAMLCKADLVTGMVGEFPELQGVMGRYYALAQKEDAAVADAIRDHYKPQGPADSVPTNPVAICVALADKLDTIVGMFGAGEKPTGSKDPFALRRAALGIIRIILDNNIRASLRDWIGFAGMRQTTASVQEEVVLFFIDRLKVQLKDQGIRHDVINAVVADGDDDLVRIVARAQALQDFLTSDDGANLLTAYRRAANILGIEEKKDNNKYNQQVDKNLLKDAAEIELAKVLESKHFEIERLRESEKFVEAMHRLAELRASVDHFFNDIMVNCEDKNIRANRLRLLSGIKDSMDSIAGFALIEG